LVFLLGEERCKATQLGNEPIRKLSLGQVLSARWPYCVGRFETAGAKPVLQAYRQRRNLAENK